MQIMEEVLKLKSKVEQKLKIHDLRLTRARIRIGMMLFDSPQHLSAGQIFEQLTKQGHGISKATVYNTLNVFAKSGMVHAVNVDPERIFYDSTISAHHHFYNIDTGQLMDIPLEDLSFEEIPKLPDNTEIEDLQVIIKVKNKASTLTSV